MAFVLEVFLFWIAGFCIVAVSNDRAFHYVTTIFKLSEKPSASLEFFSDRLCNFICV